MTSTAPPSSISSRWCRNRAARVSARLRLFSEAVDAVAGVDAIYTDTWASIGQEAEADAWRLAFASYQVPPGHLPGYPKGSRIEHRETA